MRVNYSTKRSTVREVAPGLFIALPGTATITDVELDGALYDVVMVLDLTTEGVRPTSVTVTAQPGSPHVTGTTLRAVKVWDLAREAILLGVDKGQRNGASATTVVAPTLTELEVARLRLAGPTDESLGWVAHFYNLGTALGLPPVQQVATNLDMPRTTATKWIRRARERGLITSEEMT